MALVKPPLVANGSAPLPTSVPFVDLKSQDDEIAAEVDRGWNELRATTSFILGPQVAAFESEFAAFSGVRHCIGVGSGTDALELALRAVGIGAGDQVLVPTNSFVASAVAVVRAGAAPVLVDCDPRTQLMDLADAEARVTPATRAVMPVHLYGQMVPATPTSDLAARHELLVVEDAAQSQGATHEGITSGSFGRVSATSFYPGKNIGAFGDGGAVLTDDDEVAGQVRRLRNYGSVVKYEHPEIGFNSRLDSIQAVVLSAKLRRLARWNERRRQAAARYDALLAELDLGVVRPVTAPGNLPVWHLYVIRVPDRDRVLREMSALGIGVGIHYPVPIHLQGAFAHLGHRPGEFPAAETAAQEILSLPMHPHLTAADQEQVIEALARALARS